MSAYSDFAENFLIALYQETESTEQPSQRAGDLIIKYGLEYKDLWISHVADEWEGTYFQRISKVLNGYTAWAFTISARGVRYIEDKYGSKGEVGTILQPVVHSDQPVPASDRVVSLNHNQVNAVEQPVAELVQALDQSNGDPDEPSLRQRLIGQIKAGRELLRAGEYKLAILQITLIAALEEIVVKYREGVIVNLASNLLQYLLTNGLSG